MPKNKKGAQNPTILIKRPYKVSKGDEAVEIYERTGNTAQRWQILLLRHILAVNKDGLWVHTKFGYAVPRRNGKNEITAIREMFGLLNGEEILHTAHRTSTAHMAWERLGSLLEKAKIPIKSTFRAFGREHIYLEDGGRIEFRTRTNTGGLGEGFDLLVIDEAQEYQDAHETSLKYVVSSSGNPQIIMLGTPPTPISSGTVFMKFREDCLAGKGGKNSGWAEWSVENMTDPNYKAAWYLTNPSLGYRLTERIIADEIGRDAVDFNIQRLGLWLRYNQKSAISDNEWSAVRVDTVPKLRGQLIIAVKYSHDAATVAVAVAARTEDGRTYTEVIDCRNTRAGNGWIIEFLQKTAARTRKVIVDGASGQNILAAAMKDARLKPPVLPTVREIIAANALLEPALQSKKICHSGQPALAQAAGNCEHRAIGSNGGFGYRAIREGVDITLLDSVILACWGMEEFKENQVKQQVSY